MALALKYTTSLVANDSDRPAFSDSERQFYQNAKERAKALGVSQRQIAAHLGLSEAFVSEFLNLKNRLSTNRFDELAALLQVSVAELFAPTFTQDQKSVQNVTDKTSPVTAPGVNSASQSHQGDSRNGAEARSLRAENIELRRRIGEYVAALDVATSGIAALINYPATSGRVSKAGTRKPKRGAHSA
jgi:transcriptional regulator with XRE-family HTH domain